MNEKDSNRSIESFNFLSISRLQKPHQNGTSFIHIAVNKNQGTRELKSTVNTLLYALKINWVRKMLEKPATCRYWLSEFSLPLLTFIRTKCRNNLKRTEFDWVLRRLCGYFFAIKWRRLFVAAVIVNNCSVYHVISLSFVCVFQYIYLDDFISIHITQIMTNNPNQWTKILHLFYGRIQSISKNFAIFTCSRLMITKLRKPTLKHKLTRIHTYDGMYG